MIFELSAPKPSYLNFFQKSSILLLNTEKHAFLYDRIILYPSNYDSDLSASKQSYLEFFSNIICF